MSAALSPAAGDPLPPAVAALYAALAAGDPDAAARCFAADGLYAFPSNPDEETDPRRVGEGATLREAIAADPACGLPHALRVCAHEGPDCLLEGTVLDAGGAAAQSFAASFQLAADGRLRRALAFRCAATEDAVGVDVELPPGIDAMERIGAYLHELEVGNMGAAVAYFTEDCLYAHPPYGKGLPRVEYRGHAQLKAGFERRGTLPKKHFAPAAIQRGSHLLIEGHVWVDGGPEGRTESFMSSASLAADGRVARYLSFVCEPMVPRRPD
ncbi:MAG: nuclear transport factor 2 family protein [Solirubrobacterales bacterium]